MRYCFQRVTVGHLSDSDDHEYLKEIASNGCYIAFDRLYGSKEEEYISKKVKAITELCAAGYEDKILLSHDTMFFNGFNECPTIVEKPRFNYAFDCILSEAGAELAEKISVKNPANMLSVR